MFKKLLSAVLIVAVVVSTTPDLYAGKGGGSGGGRSSSSGSRSYSSGKSSSSSSFSGKSYSSGSTKSSGKSYSSGSTSTTSKPSSGFSTTSSSGKGYSSSTKPNPGPAANSNNSGSIFGGSKSSSATSNVSNDGKSRKPSGTTFNNSLTSSAKQSQSQKQYVAATTPKSTYKTPGPNGVQKPLPANSPQVSTVRNTITHERYVTYDNRASGFYGGGFGQPMFYNDFYSPFLMGWLMSDALSSHDRATWMYHHQSDMDQTRYREMLAKDAKLQAEIDQLKAQNLAQDPSYVPPQMKDNPDLMFNKEFVEASYNPVQTSSGVGSSVGYFFYYLFVTVVVLGLVGVVAYFLFVKEY